MLFYKMESLKRNWIVTFLLVLLAAKFLLFCSEKSVQQPLDEDLPAVKQYILRTNEHFLSQVKELVALTEQDASQEVVRQKFDKLRETYKQMEWAVEYFLPHSARFINGPPLPEIEFAEHTALEPEGLQVLEELIYGFDEENRSEIVRHLKRLINKAGTIKTNFSTISVNRSQVFDALRQQIFRISSLHIAGFDTPISDSNLREMPLALESIAHNLRLISTKKSEPLAKIEHEINSAVDILRKNPDRNTFDYLTFISEHLNRISASILEFRNSENISTVNITTALSKDARHFYDSHAFDADAFVPGEKFKITPTKVALGKTLFNDPMLSKEGNRSCATCHVLEKAFTDGFAKSMSLENNPLQRNTPSLNYAALQHGQFWDMRSEDLEGQSSEVITNKDEMHGDLDEIIGRINKNEKYRKAFGQIFKTKNAEVWQLQNLLASYIRSLPKFSSRFDRFMRGETSRLNADEKKGFNLFVGKANCASCHFLPLFNGTVPPNYSKTEQEILGVAEDFHNKRIDNDPGRGRFHETVAFLQKSFKTATVRNISKTAPYMHNGGYRTLEQVMDFYNKGGGKGFGFKLENQTLPEDPLNLTAKETAQIIEFMKALEDE